MADKRETRFSEWGDAHTCALSVSSAIALAMLAVVRSYSPNEIVSALELTGLFVLFASFPVSAYWYRARLEHRLPARRPHDADNNKPRYRHISGAAALGIVCFVALISGISAWASMQQDRPNIDGLVGVGVIVMLVVVFVWVGFRSYQPGRKLKKASSEQKGFLFWLSRIFSTFDSWLVFPVANAIGMRLSRSWRRFFVLFGNLVPTLILGWFLPVPYAFVPIVWAIVSVVAIARRWSWVEDDREVAMLKRSFEDRDLRVGFSQDLRDEAMVAFALLLLLTPIVLRSAFLGLEQHVGYSISQNDGVPLSAQSYWAWLSLFGTELAKAVPFVDWAEIFEVEGDPFIVFDTTNPAYQCVIFSMRVMVDLVLLAALLQAVSIVSRTSKQKEMFYEDGTLTQLDPFIEPLELANLAAGRSGDWRIRDDAEFEAFPEYDEDRLVRLSLASEGEHEDGPLGSERSAVRFVARALSRRDERRPPEHLLYVYAKKERINEERINGLMEQIEAKRSPEIDDLIKAHGMLNQKSRLLETRKRIARLLSLNTSDPKAVVGLAKLLALLGEPRPDSRADVREIALNGLAMPAIAGNQFARAAIALASQRDNAPRVQKQAQALIDRHEDWVKVETVAAGVFEQMGVKMGD